MSQPRPPTAAHLKPTDITLSKAIQEMFPEKVEQLNQLKRRERELDLVINKKLLDIEDYQQSIAGGLTQENPDDYDILRIFIYNTSENQPWQTAAKGASPTWTLRVEGRLLGDKLPVDSPQRKKFSMFLSALSVELKARDGDDEELEIGKAAANGPDTRIIEWHDDPNMPEADRLAKQFDGLDVKRAGISIPQSEVPQGETVDPSEKEVVANIVIQPKTFPIKLQVVKDSLIELVGTNEITQADCLRKLFAYIKSNNLFEVQQNTQGKEKSGPKPVTVKADDLLFRIFGRQVLTLPQMLEALSTRLLKPIEPIHIQYSINTLRSTTLGDVVIDLKVNTKLIAGAKPGSEELASISKILSEEVLNKETAEELARLNESTHLSMQMLNYSKLKHDFYQQLAENPVEFLTQLESRNNEYLKILSSDSMSFGTNGMADEEIVRRSDFYTDEFLQQHIGLLLNSGRM